MNEKKPRQEPLIVLACSLAFLLGVFPSMQTCLLPLYRDQKIFLILFIHIIFLFVIIGLLIVGHKKVKQNKTKYKGGVLVFITTICVLFELSCATNFVISMKRNARAKGLLEAGGEK
jgi:hypothetical protein